ncbi:hypothetical protein CVT25_008090 [Psilocybe cyanescens]|uniref:Uncharacterized protein n=1 Tax=Psilocybe cyanescens TaxID=93625 RepID=A0A409X6Q2_PSICY|nr:hypothetical protein CVT25_008090 [Psilocybe cyanescens]
MILYLMGSILPDSVSNPNPDPVLPPPPPPPPHACRLTNDGNAILREIDVNMIELSRTQDEECSDGTTSVIILGAQSFLFIPPFLLPYSFYLYPTQSARSSHNLCPSSSGTSTPSSLSPPTTKPSPKCSPSIQRISVPIGTAADARTLGLIKTSIGTRFFKC